MNACTNNAEHVARRHRDVLNRCDAPDGLRVPYQTSLDTDDRAALERLMAERLVEAARPAGIEHARFTATDAGRAMRLRMDADDATAPGEPDPRHNEDPARTEARSAWLAESADTASRAARAATIRDLDALADEIAAAGDAAMHDAMATGLGTHWIRADGAGGVSTRHIPPAERRAGWYADRSRVTDTRSAGIWPADIDPAEPDEPTEPTEDTDDRDYDDLRRQIDAAFAQAATGKGRERHADGRRWTDQPIFTVARQHGVGFLTGQAAKKLGEAAAMSRRGEHAKARHEMLGAIVYAAAAAHMAEQEPDA